MLHQKEFTRPATLVGTSYYAGFWKRFAAFLLDGLVLGAITGMLSGIFGATTGSPIGALFGWLYFAGLESSPYQATLGKRVLGIRVTDLEGGRINFARATLRYFAKFVSALILMVGFVMAAWTERKQALHDFIAETLVVNANGDRW